MASPHFSPLRPPRPGWNRRAANVRSCEEMFVSDRGFVAEMHVLPAISARWAVICCQNRRACGRGAVVPADNATRNMAGFLIECGLI